MEHDYLLFLQENIILAGIALALLGLIIAIEVQRLTRRYKEVTPMQAVQLINGEKALLLDLRENHEIESGTIHSARHVAASQFTDRMDQLGRYREKPLIVFCASGVRAPGICRLLAKSGFSRVHCLKGGITAWQQAGMPLVKKQN